MTSISSTSRPTSDSIVRELIARAPERLSIVFASRRPPTVPLARLRASGEVAEIGTDDLRFDAAETARLFSETYGRDLDPDVLADVAARTEGWAASLQLVQAALRDRSPAEIRRFVRGLSGCRPGAVRLPRGGSGRRPARTTCSGSSCAPRSSRSSQPDLAAVATDLETSEVARLTAAAERLTLLSRPSRASRGRQRFHPLVREFLEARLRLSTTDHAVSALHLRVAEAASAIDWRVAAHHYREAGDHAALSHRRSPPPSPRSWEGGQYAVAGEFIDRTPWSLRLPGFGVVMSRVRDAAGGLRRCTRELQSRCCPVNPGSRGARLRATQSVDASHQFWEWR